MTSNVQCVELGKFAVPGMRIKVRWFPDGVNDEQGWHARSNILSFSRVLADSVSHRTPSNASSRFHSSGPLVFRPRSAVWTNRKQGPQVLTVSSYFDASFAPQMDNAAPEE